VQFIVFRDRWTAWLRRYSGMFEHGARREWVYRGLPYLLAGASFIWAVVMATGWFGTLG